MPDTEETVNEASPLSEAAATEPRREPVTLRDALLMLDPANDDHWTAGGLPRMEVLEDFTGGNLTRDEVTALAPDLTRASAAAALADLDSDPEAIPVSEHDLDPAPGTVDPGVLYGSCPLDERLAELEADMAFLRKQFGWPTRP